MTEPAAAMPSQQTKTTPVGTFARLQAIARGLGPAGPWLVLAVVGPLLGALALTATATMWLPCFGQDSGSRLLFVALAAVLCAMCLVPTQVTSLLAGYLFGAFWGSGLGMVVVLLAAAMGFLVWSQLLGSRVLQVLSASSRAERLHRAFFGRSFWRTVLLIALLRLSPVMPFAATNLLMAAFGVRARSFLLATTIGVAPRSIGVSLVGAQLSDLDWQAGGGRWLTILAVLATLAIVTLVSRIARNVLRHETDAVAIGADS